MLDWIARRLEVSSSVAAILLVLTIVQVATQVYALVDLARRDAVRGGRKWVWALVIALGNLPGAIAYLAAGRPPSTVEVPASGAKAAGEEAVRRAVDTLYGPRDRWQ
ncbi:MAG TPA: PLD nuclease N-terminal domain-containing protein [Gemmatimonadaceae bacterium]